VKLVSVNVGLPQVVRWQGESVTTGIFKNPVKGRIQLQRLNLDGDRQADLTVHGGKDKAVYLYPFEHYPYWRSELPGVHFPFGSFGENFTTEGLDESSTFIGDVFAIGSAKVVVTQPRMPCYKLGVKFNRADMVKRFQASHRSGLYFSVLQEGEVGAGDDIELIERGQNQVSIDDINRVYFRDRNDLTTMQRATEIDAFPSSWKLYFQEKIEKAQKPSRRSAD
jgi:MOSC domain-containing protein YiiM